MRDVRLKQTDLLVSVIAFGTRAFGGDWGTPDIQQSKQAVRRALDLGINLFDTAQSYGFGAAEQVLGEAIREVVRRDDVIIATAGGLRVDGDRLVRDATSAGLRTSVESSLRNFGTDYIDIFQVHRPDPHTPPEETAGTLAALVQEGKIRHVGASNYDVEQMRAFSRFGPLETLQAPYHMFHREIETAILAYTSADEIGVLVCGPLAHGLLSGRMTESTAFEADDWRSKCPDFSGETLRRNLAVVERLKGVARDLGISLPQLALAWTLANPAVDVAIIGARRPSQLDETAAAADVTLPESVLRTIDTILTGAVPIEGPRPEGEPADGRIPVAFGEKG